MAFSLKQGTETVMALATLAPILLYLILAVLSARQLREED
jgi:hypothetical protein